MGAGGLLARFRRARSRVTTATTRVKARGFSTLPRLPSCLFAAGRSTRMGGPNKMLAEANGPAAGRSRREGSTSLASCRDRGRGRPHGRPGAAGDRERPFLPTRACASSVNPDFAEGLSTSVRTGIGTSRFKEIDAVIVQLGDMPGVSSSAARPPDGGVQSRRGPLDLRAHRCRQARQSGACGPGASLPEIAKVAGDTGAKHLIGEHADLVCEVEMTGEAAITDIDTPEALAAWKARVS
jgi:molybdenum cofactor cytidylyltransferase